MMSTIMRTEGDTSWLCPSEGDRERLLDMEVRLRPYRTLAFATLGLALIITGAWVGWWTLIPLALIGVVFALADHAIDRSRLPEYRLFTAWALSELAIAVGVAHTGGPRSPAVAWLALPVVTLPARFSLRAVVLGVVLTAAMLVGCTVGVHPDYALDNPQSFVFPLALLVGTAVLSLALMQSERQHRSASVIDPLTSMLNRIALRARAQELAHQARVIHQPIAVVVADVDGFKQINDSHGHAVGDAVLRDLAYRMRKQLRAFDLVYRLGGEEFVILLPGADAEQGAQVAEQLRAAVADKPVDGLEVTISVGVAASAPGSFDYDAVFRAADAALYQAKRAGRNRVSVAAPTGYQPLARAEPQAV